MDKKQWLALIPLAVMLTLLSACLAESATGTLKYSFRYKDPATAVETALPNGFLYLRSTTLPPPMERFFSKADYINRKHLGDGNYLDAQVPAGTWYIRVTQRNTPMDLPYGPPEAGDYTWFQTIPITVVAGQTLDLGTLYAVPFAPSPITITGTVRNQFGRPVAGIYVRAQSQPCYNDGANSNVNYCGPDKFPSQPSDANGKYTLQLREPGSYYLYSSACLTAERSQYTGNHCEYAQVGWGPVPVKPSETKNIDVEVFSYN